MLPTDEEFTDKHARFMREHCTHFEESEENKLIYMEIFQKYTSDIERYITGKLTNAIAHFSMEEFYEMLETREDQIVGDVFEMLLSFADFDTFKAIMLSYKKAYGGTPISPSVSPMK
jgi:ADP-ribosylation factor-like protein 2-binding protein